MTTKQQPVIEIQPPIVGGDLWKAVTEAAGDQCQYQGKCGAKHLDRARKPSRCQNVNGMYKKGRGWMKLLAIPRDPTTPWHEAAALPPGRLIAYCPPCADGVRRAINRAVKALPPGDGLFDAEPFRATEGESNPT